MFNLQKKESFRFFGAWFFNTFIPLILGSLILTGAVSVYKSRADLNSYTTKTEFKKAQEQRLNCYFYGKDYLGAVNSTAGTFYLINKHIKSVYEKGAPNKKDVKLAKILQEQQLKNKEKREKYFRKYERCNMQLAQKYRNIAILLNFKKDYTKRFESDRGQISLLTEKNKEFIRSKAGKINFSKAFNLMLNGTNMGDFNKILNKADFGDLATYWNRQRDITKKELEASRRENEKINDFIARNLKEKLNKGIMRYLPEIIY
ncbi:hypothetical protein [Thiohalorhabdus methylotrophus]|uniref:Uncharacterized protein n=1 Tax=Thiohalorhabdus methylotrophus TaxID=3242694 RepID=A0ABV4U1D9_9GAMM